LIGAALIASTFATPVLADWWIVRSSDGTCLVVDIGPTGKDKGLTKIGKDSYQTAEQAEADVKRLCKATAQPNTIAINYLLSYWQVRMSALSHLQTSRFASPMSALRSKADVLQTIFVSAKCHKGTCAPG
jgi:hypothetical protein